MLPLWSPRSAGGRAQPVAPLRLDPYLPQSSQGERGVDSRFRGNDGCAKISFRGNDGARVPVGPGARAWGRVCSRVAGVGNIRQYLRQASGAGK